MPRSKAQHKWWLIKTNVEEPVTTNPATDSNMGYHLTYSICYFLQRFWNKYSTVCCIMFIIIIRMFVYYHSNSYESLFTVEDFIFSTLLNSYFTI